MKSLLESNFLQQINQRAYSVNRNGKLNVLYQYNKNIYNITIKYVKKSVNSILDKQDLYKYFKIR